MEAKSALPVALDAMGGDLGPDVVVEGAVETSAKLSIPIVLVGNHELLSRLLEKYPREKRSQVTVHSATEVVGMDESPSAVLRSKPDASVRVAFELVKRGDACAVVSAGNTGAVMAAGLLVSGALPGIVRPAIASLLPRVGEIPPAVLLDCGANADCSAQQLVQFAIMGKHYAERLFQLNAARVALLSNGTESSKGNDVIRAAGSIMEKTAEIQFVGYVEGNDLVQDAADVIVCDGLVGNIVLKAMEGAVSLMFDSLQQMAENTSRGKLKMWLTKSMIRQVFRERFDPASYGGAPLLGLQDAAIVCHGHSSGRAIGNAVRVARCFYKESVVDRLREALALLDWNSSGSFQDGLWNRFEEKLGKPGKKYKKEV